MERKLLHYSIEVRDPATGWWIVTKEYKPHWMFEEKTVTHHFLFWKWETTHRTVSRVEEGNLQCRKDAVSGADNYKYDNPQKDVRVRKTKQFGNKLGKHIYSVTVWRNCVWEDC